MRLSVIPAAAPLFTCFVCKALAASVSPEWQNLPIDTKAFKICEDPSMDYSEVAYVSGNYQDVFEGFIENAKKNNATELSNKGAASYFGHAAFSRPNFHCGIFDGGCRETPSCEDVAKYIINKNETVSLEYGRAQARWRYLVALRMEDIAKTLFHVQEGVLAVQLSTTEVAKKYSRVYFPQVDETAESACKALKKKIEMIFSMIQAILSAIQVGLSTFSGGAAQATADVATTLTKAAKSLTKAQKIAQNAVKPANSGARDFAWSILGSGFSMSVTEIKQVFLEMTESKLQLNPDAEKRDGTPWNPAFPMAILKGDSWLGCQRYGAGRDKWEASKREEIISEWIKNSFGALRGSFADLSKRAFQGDGSVLLELLSNESVAWQKLREMFHDSKESNEFEKVYTRAYGLQLMSFCMRNAHTYVKCEMSTDLKRINDLCDVHQPKHEFRFCPANSNEACAVQSQTARSNWNREVDFWGGKEFKDDFGSYHDGIRDSYQKYMDDKFGEKSTKKNSVDEVINSMPTGIDFAICRGHYVNVTNYAGGNSDPNDNPERDQAFPCMCGEGWDSDYTETFLGLIHLQPNSTTRTDGDYKDIARVCSEQITRKKLTPAEDLYARCNYGINAGKDKDGKAKDGPHDLCDRVKLELNGKSKYDANVILCAQNFTITDEVVNTLGYKEMCKQFNKGINPDATDPGLTQILQPVVVVTTGADKNITNSTGSERPPSDMIADAEREMLFPTPIN